MSFDAVCLAVVAAELDKKLRGAKIEKLTQPEREEIELLLYGREREKLRLVVSANAASCRMHLTRRERGETGAVAAGFCMLLRKNLPGGVVESVSAQNFERLIEIKITAKEDLGYLQTRYLVAELTGKSANIFLLDENRVILGGIKPRAAEMDEGRLLITGAKHVPLDERGRLAPDEFKAVTMRLAAARDVKIETAKHVLENCLRGVSSATLGEIFAGADYNSLSDENIALLMQNLRALIENMKTPAPNVVYGAGGAAVTALPFEYKTVRGQKRFFPTMSEALDEFFSSGGEHSRFKQRVKTLSQTLKNAVSRHEKKAAIHQKTLADAKDAEYLRVCGELILTNLWQVVPQSPRLRVQNYYEDDAPEIEIELDITKNGQQNAQNYFKKYRKIKMAAQYAKTLLTENLEKIEYYKGLLLFLKHCDDAAALTDISAELEREGLIKPTAETAAKDGAKTKKGTKTAKSTEKKAFAGEPRRFEIGDFTVLAGRTNAQNAELTFKTAGENDLWLHAQNCTGAHVIILCGEREVPDGVLQAAAEIAAFYSERGGGGKAPVDYTRRREIKRPPKAAALAIYHVYSTLIVQPNEHKELKKD